MTLANSFTAKTSLKKKPRRCLRRNAMLVMCSLCTQSWQLSDSLMLNLQIWKWMWVQPAANKCCSGLIKWAKNFFGSQKIHDKIELWTEVSVSHLSSCVASNKINSFLLLCVSLFVLFGLHFVQAQGLLFWSVIRYHLWQCLEIICDVRSWIWTQS